MSTTSCGRCCATCARRRSPRTPPTSTRMRAYTDEAFDGADRLRVHRDAHSRGVRRAGRRLRRGLHRDRRGRACVRVVVVDPDLQQAGHHGPDLCAALRNSKSRCCRRSLRARRWRPTRCPNARPAATRRRCEPAPARDGDAWVLNGSKCWISNGGHSTWYTVMAVTDPDKGASGISAFMVHKDDEGFTVGPKEKKLGIKGSPTTELYFEDCRIPGDRIIGEPGTGFKTALQLSTTPDRPSARRRSASRRARLTPRSHIPRSASSSASRSAISRLCSSCSPTWR